MPQFGPASLAHLATCHEDLQRLLQEIVKYFDCKIIIGHRGEAAQNEAYRTGHSRKRWPDGEHNKLPSEAVDVAPSPVDWKNTERNYFFAGQVVATARQMGLKIRAGADWDGDGNPRNQTLHDPGHFELI
jgi:hypothetical protein